MHNKDNVPTSQPPNKHNLLLTGDLRPTESNPQAFTSGDIGTNVRVSSARSGGWRKRNEEKGTDEANVEDDDKNTRSMRHCSNVENKNAVKDSLGKNRD